MQRAAHASAPIDPEPHLTSPLDWFASPCHVQPLILAQAAALPSPATHEKSGHSLPGGCGLQPPPSEQKRAPEERASTHAASVQLQQYTGGAGGGGGGGGGGGPGGPGGPGGRLPWHG